MYKKWSVFMFVLVVALTSLITPLNAKAQAEQKINDLWDEKDFELAELILDQLNVYTNHEGKQVIEILDVNALDKGLSTLDSEISASELEDVVANFNDLINSEEENAITDLQEHVASEMDAVNSELNGDFSTMAISCSDALTIIGFVHAGSFGAAALALGISGGLSFTIPLIISAAYTAASLACD